MVSLASPGVALPPTGAQAPESNTYSCPVEVSTYVVPSVGVPVGPPVPLNVNSFVGSLSPSRISIVALVPSVIVTSTLWLATPPAPMPKS